MGSALGWSGIAGSTALGAALAFAGSDGSVKVGGVPAFALCVALAFAIQWVLFVPAWIRRSERFFDLTGSATFLAVAALAVLGAGELGARGGLIAFMVGIWAVRLGLFLSRRVRLAGSDARFTRLKRNFAMFLMTWTLQGLWVSLSCAPGLAAIVSTAPAAADGWLLAGALVWIAGVAIEVIADEQKRRFRSDPDNAGRFIATGLWRLSQHPNYFGEIVLWCGIAIAAVPALQGWQYATLLAPLLIWLQLTRISGVPLLDAAARRRWGDDPDYQRYRERTPMLVPRPPEP